MKTKLILAYLLCAGCANVNHVRETVTVTATTTNKLTEKESARFFLQKEVAQKLNSTTRDNPTNYYHSVTATGVSVQGDSELVKEIFNGAANITGAAVEGAVRGVKK